MPACQRATAVWDAQGYGYGRAYNFAGVPDPHDLLTPQSGGAASSDDSTAAPRGLSAPRIRYVDPLVWWMSSWP